MDFFYNLLPDQTIKLPQDCMHCGEEMEYMNWGQGVATIHKETGKFVCEDS
jgi:hypothetical protein